MAAINNTMTGFQGGTASVTGVSPTAFTRFINTWAVGDKFVIVLTDSTSGVETTIGAGDASGLQPTFVFTYNKKVYALYSDKVFMSAIDQPLVWNDPNASGNADIQMSDFNGTAMQLVGMMHYQGRLLFGSRDCILCYSIDADPTQWALQQTFQNIGFLAPLPVQALGDLDVIFLSDTGFRSIRVRDSSLNAYVSDIGSPVDLIIQAVLLGASPNVSGSCGIVEPATGRYWCFLKDTIYVLSYYPTNKIVAWSTYLPTYDNGAGVQTAFVPTVFDTYKGQVYCRASDGAIVLYDTSGYDGCTATVETPFFDNKAPATRKSAKAMDIQFTGLWTLYGCMDMKNKNFTKVQDTSATPTVDNESYPYSDEGTHFKFKATCSDANAATLASLILHYEDAGEKQ